MRHSYANGDSGVLKNVNVLNVRIRGQFLVPAGPQANYLAPMRRGKLGGREVVIGVVQDNVGGAACPGMRKQAGFGKERRVIQTERGEIVGVEIDVVVFGDAAGARAKRTPAGGHLWPVLAVGGHHHPLAQQRMPTQFVQRLHTFILGSPAAEPAAYRYYSRPCSGAAARDYRLDLGEACLGHSNGNCAGPGSGPTSFFASCAKIRCTRGLFRNGTGSSFTWGTWRRSTGTYWRGARWISPHFTRRSITCLRSASIRPRAICRTISRRTGLESAKWRVTTGARGRRSMAFRANFRRNWCMPPSNIG